MTTQFWYLPLVASALLALSIGIGFSVMSVNNVLQLVDRYSAANLNYIESVHYDLDLTIDFDASVYRGSVTHTLKSIATGIGRVVLDTRDLKISKVYNAVTKKELSWAVYPFTYITNMKNDMLVIEFDHYLNYGEIIKVTIEYVTSPTATAVSWVPESQTFGKKYKFMYTQCESVQARSIVPIMDTPGIKSTYNATLRVAAPYVAIASAIFVSNRTEGNMNIYQYQQKIPIPSYLLAIVAGNIAYKKTGERAGVYAEPEILDKSVYELTEMDQFMNIIERTITPYQWGIYGVIIMPPSFPFGGMENPYITFVSPSIIIGDRSSAYVVAHEICHSWFGNQLTAKNWSHFWLNEGFTRYSERLIIKELYGERRYITQVNIGISDLQDLVENFVNNGCPECTKLFPNLYHAGPDDIMSDVAYEKGFLFLKHLESLTGADNFYDFLRAYLATLSYRSVDAWEMKEIFEHYVNNYLKHNATEILAKANFQQWFFDPGMPKGIDLNYTNEDIKNAVNLAFYYVDHKEGPSNKQIYNDFSLDLRVIVMRKFIERDAKLTQEALRAFDKDFDVTHKERNPEVLVLWFRTMVAHKCTEVNDRAKEFLGSIGRQKYIVPIYTAYAKTDKALGMKIYQEFKSRYHPIAQRRIEKLFA